MGIGRAGMIAGICVLLAGCAGSPLGDAITGPEKLAAQDDSYCRSIGAAKGTPSYTDCRLRVAQMREQRHAAAMAGGPTVCNRVGYTTICN